MAEQPSNLAGLILAAGQSKRFGVQDKRFASLRGKPLIRYALEAAHEAGLSPLIVVLDPDSLEHEALSGLSITPVANSSPEQGLGSSLAVGAQALDAPALGIAVLLGDMPGVSEELISRLARVFREAGGQKIVAPVVDGRRGHPVLWPWSDIEALRGLSGDVGAKALIKAAGDRLLLVEVEDTGCLLDIDRPQDLAALAGVGG